VFHAATPAFDVAALAAVPPERYAELRFSLSPASRLITSDYPLLAIWRANQAESADTSVDLDAGGDRLLVFRRDLEVEFKRLSAGEYTLLAAWQRGAALHEASDAAVRAETGFDLTRCLQQHVALSTILNPILSNPGEQQ